MVGVGVVLVCSGVRCCLFVVCVCACVGFVMCVCVCMCCVCVLYVLCVCVGVCVFWRCVFVCNVAQVLEIMYRSLSVCCFMCIDVCVLCFCCLGPDVL